ncbi:MAG: ubiquinone/menaquinone biosynthesis methyltransferase [Dehalococcoidia bacterium]
MGERKEELIRSEHLYEMFTSVPPRYDLINHLITMGLDWQWRREAAKECLAALPGRMLDLCCGTGDLVIRVAGMVKGETELVGLDFSRPMLMIAAGKATGISSGKGISFVHGDATKMHFPDSYFNCVGISFAFRNLTYKNPMASQHLSEVFRVLKQGGRFVIVESSQPRNKFIRKLGHFYIRLVVPRLGYLLSGDKGAYQYLAESMTNYYTPDEIRAILLKAGFSEVRYRPLFFGTAGIHVAIK